MPEPAKTRINEMDRIVGARLREIRIQHGLNQMQLAEIAGVTYQQVHKYETGTNRLTVSRLHTILKAMNFDITEFFSTLGSTAGEETEQRTLHLYISRAAQQVTDPSKLRAIKQIIELM